MNQDLKKAVLDVLKYEADRRNYGLLSTYKPNDRSYRIMSEHGVKIRGNSIFQNDTEIAKIERRYASRKTHGVYKELIPNIVENNPAERAEEQKAEEYILCVDLDGTATHFNLVPLTALYEKGYFRNLLPHENVVEAINQIAREDNGIGVYVASSYLTDSEYALEEKNEWVDEFLPTIDAEHRIFIPNGENKADHISQHIGREIDDKVSMLDDYTANATDIQRAGGNAIKLLNEINGVGGTWQGDRIRFDRPDFKEQLVSLVKSKTHLRDERYIAPEIPEPTISYQTNVTGSHSGQLYASIVAFADYDEAQERKVIGSLDYTVYDDVPSVSMIEVDEAFRRQGIGRAMLQRLQSEYPDAEIEFGYTTELGTPFVEAITYTVTDDRAVERLTQYSELVRLQDERQREIDTIYGLLEEAETRELTTDEMKVVSRLEEAGDEWQALYDEIRAMRDEVDALRPYHTFVYIDDEEKERITQKIVSHGENERSGRMAEFSEEELQRVHELAVRIDEFMYDYDYYSYMDALVGEREDNVADIEDALKRGEIDDYEEALAGIREEYFYDYSDKLDLTQLDDEEREMVERIDAITKDLVLWGNDHDRIAREQTLIAPEDEALNLVTQGGFTEEQLRSELERRNYNRVSTENLIDLVSENPLLSDYSDAMLRRAIEIAQMRQREMEQNAQRLEAVSSYMRSQGYDVSADGFTYTNGERTIEFSSLEEAEEFVEETQRDRLVERYERVTASMREMGYRENFELSSINNPTFDYDGQTFPLSFNSLEDAEEWIDNVVIDDPEVADTVDRIMHPDRYAEQDELYRPLNEPRQARYDVFYDYQTVEIYRSLRDNPDRKLLWGSDNEGLNGDSYITYTNISDLPPYLRDYARVYEQGHPNEREEFLQRNTVTIDARYYEPTLDLDGTADELYTQARNGYITDISALNRVEEILHNEGKEDEARRVHFMSEREAEDTSLYSVAQMKLDMLDGHGGIDDVAISENDDSRLALSVMYETSNNTVLISLQETASNSIGTGATSVSLDEFLDMSREDFERTVNEVYAYSMEREDLEPELVPIREFRDALSGRAYEGSNIGLWNAIHNEGMPRDYEGGFYNNRSIGWNAVRDFLQANPVTPIGNFENTDVEDYLRETEPETVYELYDMGLALSHREELREYDSRVAEIGQIVTNSDVEYKRAEMAELSALAEIYYARESGYTSEQIDFVIEAGKFEAERSPYYNSIGEAMRQARGMIESGLDLETARTLMQRDSSTRDAILGSLNYAQSEEQRNIILSANNSHTVHIATMQIIAHNHDVENGRGDERGLLDKARALVDVGNAFHDYNEPLRREYYRTNDDAQKASLQERMIDFRLYEYSALEIMGAMADNEDAQRGITISAEEIRMVGEKIVTDSPKMNTFNDVQAFVLQQRESARMAEQTQEQTQTAENSHGENTEQKASMPVGRDKTSTQASTSEERLNELRNMVRDGVESVRNEEAFKAWLNTRSQNFMNKYSFNNIILVAFQRPDASTVMGFEQWKAFGRQVAKGSKGISVFAPNFYKEKESGNLCRDIMANLTDKLQKDPSSVASYTLPNTLFTFSMRSGSPAITVSIMGNSYELQNRQQLNEFLQKNVLGVTPRSFTVQSVFDVNDTITPNFLQMKSGFTQSELVRGKGDGVAIENEEGKVLAKARFSKDPEAPRGYEWVDRAEVGKGTWDLVTAKENEPIVTNPKRKSYEKPEYLIYNTEERKARFNQELQMSVVEKDPATMMKLFESLKALSESKGVPVMIVDRTDPQWQGGEANGYFKRTEGIEKAQYPKGYIVIPKDLVDNEPTRACKTLIHEEAHADLHGVAGKLDAEMGEKVTRAMKETQAESIAYMVCKNFGIDTSDYSFKYLATWASDTQMQDFEKSLKVIDSEAKQLVDEINAELEVRGLSRTLEELPKEPLSQETLTAEARKYAQRAVEARGEIDALSESIPTQIENAQGNADKLSIVMQQKSNLENQHSEVDKQIALAVELEKTTDSREAQELVISKLESSFERSGNLRLAFNDLSESLKTIATRSKEGLREQFEQNPQATLNRMAKEYEPLKALTATQIQYIAKSPYVREALAPLLSSNPSAFADAVAKRANEAMQVASKSGVFVEVISCKQTTEPPVFKGGEIAHPKVADKMVSEAEMQIRQMKANTDFYPNMDCKVAVYSLTEKKNLSCYVAPMKIGDSTQTSLSDFIHKVAPDKKPLIEVFDTALKERGAKDKIYVPNVSHGENTVEIPKAEPTRTTMEEAMTEIGERRENSSQQNKGNEKGNEDRGKNHKDKGKGDK